MLKSRSHTHTNLRQGLVNGQLHSADIDHRLRECRQFTAIAGGGDSFGGGPLVVAIETRRKLVGLITGHQFADEALPLGVVHARCRGDTAASEPEERTGLDL